MSENTNWLPPTAYPEPPPKPRQIPLWAPFAALLAAVIVISLIGAVAFALVHASDPSVKADDPPVSLTLILTGVQDAAFVFAAWITVSLSLGRVRREDFGLRWPEHLGRAIGWMALVMVAFWVITALLSAIDKPGDQQLVTDVKNEDSFALLAGYFVLICLIAPFVEEFFFRGFLFGVLWKRLGVAWAAVIAGVTFGLGHAPAPWVSLTALAVFGIGLCLLYWRTGSIVPGMALHALNNSITFGAIRDLDPAAFAGVVCLSVGAVTAVGAAVSARRTQVAR